MFSWITGPRITNVVEDLHRSHTAPPTQHPGVIELTDVADDAEISHIEPPETPAPVFAVRAFKQALFGTPQPVDNDTKKAVAGDAAGTNVTKDLRKTATSRTASQEDAFDPIKLPASPTKPTGILMTPGTVAARRKTVSFGAQVLDNERPSVPGVTGLPRDCPGKFPSPWTPKTAEPPEGRSRTRLTAALYEVRDSSRKSKSESESSDDILPIAKPMDAGELPSSESEEHWREQFLSYSERSKREVKKLIAKQKMAKDYAQKKDAEAMELATKLKTERKRHKLRELELEAQVKDHQERLRQLMAENLRCTTEIATLRQRLESSGDVQPATALGSAVARAKPLAADKENVRPSQPADQIAERPRSPEHCLQTPTSPSPSQIGGFDRMALPFVAAPRQPKSVLTPRPNPQSPRNRGDRARIEAAAVCQEVEPAKPRLPADRAAGARARVEARKRRMENMPVRTITGF